MVEDAALMGWGFLESHRFRDRRREDQVSEDTLDFFTHLPGQDGPAIKHGDQNPENLQTRVRPSLDLVDGVEKIICPLQGEV